MVKNAKALGYTHLRLLGKGLGRGKPNGLTHIHFHLLHLGSQLPLTLCLLGLLGLQLLLQRFDFVIGLCQLSLNAVQSLLQGGDVALQSCSPVLCC